MTLGRIFGDRLVDRFGPEAVVRAGGGIAAVGFGLALLVAAPVAAIAGFACLGAGMSGVVPIVFRASGHVARHGRRRRAGRGLEHRLPRLPGRAADDRRPGRADRACPRALGVLVLLAVAVALLARTTRYARAGARVAREPQTVAA